LPDAICDTSAIQYLYQLDLLDVLPDLVGSITFPPAVVNELAEGRAQGVRLPTPEERGWATVQAPTSTPALPLVTDLGPGETQVLALALEEPGTPVILDDALARRAAKRLDVPLTGTLGILVDAKQAGLLPVVAPLLDRLEALRFHLDDRTRAAVLEMAGEPNENR